jgi:hypothetical protein
MSVSAFWLEYTYVYVPGLFGLDKVGDLDDTELVWGEALAFLKDKGLSIEK